MWNKKHFSLFLKGLSVATNCPSPDSAPLIFLFTFTFHWQCIMLTPVLAYLSLSSKLIFSLLDQAFLSCFVFPFQIKFYLTGMKNCFPIVNHDGRGIAKSSIKLNDNSTRTQSTSKKLLLQVLIRSGNFFLEILTPT